MPGAYGVGRRQRLTCRGTARVFSTRAPALPGPLTRRWGRAVGRGGVAGARGTWCGAGGCLPTEVMHLAGGCGRRANVAPAKKGWRERTVCFLLAGTGVLLPALRYNIKLQLDSRQARPSRWLQRAAVGTHWPEAARAARALRSGAGGARQSAARTPRRVLGCRRLGDASPAPAASRAARDCFPRPYLSLKLIFFFNLVTGTRVTGKYFVKAKRGHKLGPFTAFVTKYSLCWTLTQQPLRQTSQTLLSLNAGS